MKPIAILFLCAGLSAQQPGVSPGPPVPYEDFGACPFEGCSYLRPWTTNRPVVVRTGRRADAPVAFRLRKGVGVRPITGVVITTKPGRVEFHLPFEVNSELVIPPGQTLYLLTYLGEGFTKAWFQGQLFESLDGSRIFNESCDQYPERCDGRVVERPTRIWWVQLRDARGRIGWSSEPEAFDGKDALGG